MWTAGSACTYAVCQVIGVGGLPAGLNGLILAKLTTISQAATRRLPATARVGQQRQAREDDRAVKKMKPYLRDTSVKYVQPLPSLPTLALLLSPIPDPEVP